MSDAASFCVLLTRPEQRDPLTLAIALASARKTPVQDQVNAAKSSWGILAENLGEPEAKTLAGLLTASGLSSAALPASSLATVPTIQPLLQWEPALTDGLILIAAAGITVTSTTTKTIKEGPNAAQKAVNMAILLGTGLPIKIGGKTRTVEKTQVHSDLLFYLDLLYKDPPRRRRIDAQHFDYSYLKERKLYFVMGNFKLLIGDLVAAVPSAWKNHGTRVLLEGKPVQTMGYETLADLERETRWLLTLIDRATGGSPYSSGKG